MDLTIAATTHVLGHLVLLHLPVALVLLPDFLRRSPRRTTTTLRRKPIYSPSSCEPRTSTLDPQDRKRRQVGVGEAGGGS
ncbi:hypothetical protein BD310DRAFT_939719 [Dichomitus squalens]|uniref:Uncharacterized protein n=1 Tax=Dichomitus squalens TaxID=114155 RepID=A0A4Q9PGW2_9APHY|nr:hypothetical protein BD310DRAFT_939719 [Dichomitus squalens]